MTCMRTRGWAVVGLLALAVAGCGRGSGIEKYIPKEEAARKALDAVLASWQSGQRPGTVKTAGTPVEVIDSKWGGGQKLASYQILKEEPGQGPRWFSVKLVLQKPAKEEVVRYVVVGNSPLWVYREEDYKKASGMGT